MELIIADSGSTKTAWHITSRGNSFDIVTRGLNPWQATSQDVTTVLLDDILPKAGSGFSGSVFFYGAGCASKANAARMRADIQSVFPTAAVNVQTDILGAAKALSGDQPAICAILGTGSASCLYNGREITNIRPSPGYILGDEGGGSHIGKTFLSAYLYGELPAGLRAKFEKETGMEQAKIMEGVYKRPQANMFMASFTKFVTANRNEPICSAILHESFSLFIRHHLLFYKGTCDTTHFIGSVAVHNKSLLEDLLKQHDLKAGKFLEDPMKELIAYHNRN